METKNSAFDTFWTKFPRRVAKADAIKAWQQTAADRPPLLQLLQAVDEMMKWREKLRARQEFVPTVPYPATWLRGHRWADEFDDAEVAEDRTLIEAREQWLALVKARADDDPRSLTDYRTRYAISHIGWPALMNMRADQRTFYGRDFLRLFREAPEPKPRAQVHVLQIRRVSNG